MPQSEIRPPTPKICLKSEVDWSRPAIRSGIEARLNLNRGQTPSVRKTRAWRGGDGSSPASRAQHPRDRAQKRSW
jgi:hypothetical protein